MAILDDTALFVAIIQQGGFSHAAKYLGISNGLVSRRVAQLESNLGVTLIKRTTRQIHLTPEGEVFWQHAQRIQQEINAAVSLIQASSKKPKGKIRITAPPFFGRHYLTDIITKFLSSFPDINIDLILTNQKLDPIEEKLDLIIRGAGYLAGTMLKNSNMQMRSLVDEKIGLYASPAYLQKRGEPKSPDLLTEHDIINYSDKTHYADKISWEYVKDSKKLNLVLKPIFNCNDIESALAACTAGYGIGRFTELNAMSAIRKQQLCPILTSYGWGDYHLFAIYPQQKALPKRSRLLLDYICTHVASLSL